MTMTKKLLALCAISVTGFAALSTARPQDIKPTIILPRWDGSGMAAPTLQLNKGTVHISLLSVEPSGPDCPSSVMYHDRIYQWLGAFGDLWAYYDDEFNIICWNSTTQQWEDEGGEALRDEVTIVPGTQRAQAPMENDPEE
jgi:hypothetical protein